MTNILSYHFSFRMIIYVRPLLTNKGILTLEVESSDRIEDLKYKLLDKYNYPPSELRLFFQSKQLEDGETLDHYEIKEFDTVQLCLRVRG